jgi:hypothetical protein
MIKKNKKAKKPEPTVTIQSYQLEDVEINDFNDIIDDKLVEGLQQISIKKVTTTVFISVILERKGKKSK